MNFQVPSKVLRDKLINTLSYNMERQSYSQSYQSLAVFSLLILSGETSEHPRQLCYQHMHLHCGLGSILCLLKW